MQEYNVEYKNGYAVADLSKMAYQSAHECIDLPQLRIQAQKTPNFVFFGNFAKEGDLITEGITELVHFLNQESINALIFFDTGAKWANTSMHNGLEYGTVKFFYVEYFAWQCYNYLIEQQRQPLNQSWNSQAKKFLFLTGKYYKLNRAWLLYKFNQSKLLDRCVWSLFVDHHALEQVPSCIPGVSNNEFVAFCKKHARNPDQITMWYGQNHSGHGKSFYTHYPGFPFDHTLYEDSLFRVIPETRDTHQDMLTYFLTEKTWITILCKQPFLMAASPYMLYNLERMGFKTFVEYLKVPHYDFIQDDSERYNAVAANAQHWLEAMDHKDNIQSDVEHNYNRLLCMIRDTCNQVQSQLHKMGVTDATISDILPLEHWIPNEEKYYSNDQS